MFTTRSIRAGLGCAILAGGTLLAVASNVASASPRPHSFASNQAQLEQQLASRLSQLNRVGADIAAAKSLTSAHAAILDTNAATATTNIKALSAKVPTDKTQAQLNTDRASMLKQNRVFAVLTPQVFLTIEADSVTALVTVFLEGEPALQSSVNLLIGQHGYANALSHYLSFVKSVNESNDDATHIADSVLAQVPADFPGDTSVFVNANKKLLSAEVALAHASYDESVIGLAAGGYTGS